MTIGVLIAEDHAIVREGFRLLLQESPELSVEGTAADGEEAIRLAREVRPDVVLMDLAMPGTNGLEATRRIRDESPEIRVIMLSMYAQEEYVLHAFQAGASGYLLKDSAPEELEEAVRAVHGGARYLDHSLPEHVMRDYAARTRTSDILGRLSDRQLEVLRLMVAGKATKEIAFELGISPKTVETHRTKMMERLQIRDVPTLVRFALDHQLILSVGTRLRKK